jgi:hypothetical protein
MMKSREQRAMDMTLSKASGYGVFGVERRTGLRRIVGDQRIGLWRIVGRLWRIVGWQRTGLWRIVGKQRTPHSGF